MPVYQGSVTLRDAYNRQTTKRYEVDAVDHTTALAEFNALCVDLAALSMAEIISYTCGLKTAYTDTVTAGANLDAGITLSVEVSTGEKATLKVPAPVASVINTDGTVDVTAALVADYVDNWITGNFLVSDGEEVSTLLSGKLDR